MKTMTLPTLLALGTALLSAHPAQAADEFYVTIDGVKQGQFHGESTQKGHSDQITGLKYDYSATVPTSTSGLPTGKSRHTPVVFEKEWGAATTQIYQALANNETLRTVTFEFYSPSPAGVQKLAFRITLTNATIVGIHQHICDNTTLDSRRYEDVSLNFQKITIEDETSSAGDTVSAEIRGASPLHPLQLAARALLPAHPSR